MEHIFNIMETKIMSKMNQFVDRDVTNSKIKFALNQMNPNKAHGPNRMNAFFFYKK